MRPSTAVLLFCAFTGISNAATVYNNFGTTPPFNVISPALYGDGEWLADAFTSANTYQLTSITVATGRLLADDAITIHLMSDNSGVPGLVLESWSVSHPPAFGTSSTITVNDTLGLDLLPGTQYWIALSGSIPLDNDWALSSTGTTGFVEIGNPTLGWTKDAIPLPNEAFQVMGTQLPEPASFGLIALGIGLLWLRSKRRSRKLPEGVR